MVYLFVFLTLFSLTVKGYCGKKVGVFATSPDTPFLFNLVRILLCVLIGGVMVLLDGAQSLLLAEEKMLLICALSGISNAAFLVFWLFAIQKNSLVTVDVTLTLGSILPAILCALFFGEAISLPKMIGFGLIILASFILSSYNKQTMGSHGIVGGILLFFAMLGDGMTSFSQQLYRQYYTEGGLFSTDVVYPKSVFHFYSYIFSAIALATVLAIFVTCQHKKRSETAPNFWKYTRVALAKPFPYIVVMAVCLFAGNYFQTVATSDYGMSSQILYPVIKGGCLITVTFTAMLFFGERPTRRSLLGSSVALVGIVLMNII